MRPAKDCKPHNSILNDSFIVLISPANTGIWRLNLGFLNRRLCLPTQKGFAKIVEIHQLQFGY